MEKVFSDQPEPVKIYPRADIENWEIFSMNKNDQRTCTRFLAKY